MVKFPALCGKVPKGGNRYLACIISYSAHVFLTHPEQSILPGDSLCVTPLGLAFL